MFRIACLLVGLYVSLLIWLLCVCFDCFGYDLILCLLIWVFD